jgi:hypothetical protein
MNAFLDIVAEVRRNSSRPESSSGTERRLTRAGAVGVDGDESAAAQRER